MCVFLCVCVEATINNHRMSLFANEGAASATIVKASASIGTRALRTSVSLDFYAEQIVEPYEARFPVSK